MSELLLCVMCNRMENDEYDLLSNNLKIHFKNTGQKEAMEVRVAVVTDRQAAKQGL